MALIGLKEVDIKLQGLSQVFGHKIVGSAIFRAAKPMEISAKNFVVTKIKHKAKSTGNLERSIKRVRTPIRKANTIGEVKLGPTIGARAADTSARATFRRGYHANLIEFGTKNRPPGGWYRSFPNAKPTSSAAQPFMRPAYEQTNDEVMGNIGKNMNIILRRYIKTGRLSEL